MGTEASESCECRFFAVYVPIAPPLIDESGDNPKVTGSSGESGGVFTTLEEALKEVKRLKNQQARFKPFSSFDSAAFYARNGRIAAQSPRRELFPSEPPLPGSPYPSEVVKEEKRGDGEKPLPFDKPTWANLSQLRRLIEKNGSVEEIRQLLRDNPRLLINSNGYVIPTVMHTGMLYHSMHITARSGRLDVARLLLRCEEFMSLLYPDDHPDLNERRCDDLRSGLLNRPERYGETALFFAVKGGHRDLVRFLLLQPQSEREVRNTRGESCYDVCERLSSPLREEIKQMLSEHQLFVPLFRTIDNSAPPTLGQPCRHLLFESDPRLNDDNVTYSPGRAVRNAIVKRKMPTVDSSGNYPFLAAWLGPCDKAVAEDLFRRWSSCKGDKNLVDMKRSDLQKGMERIGRRLSEEANVSWAEYWGFLDSFTDIRNDCGLELFEQFLKISRTNLRFSHALENSSFSTNSENDSTEFLLDDGNDVFHDSFDHLDVAESGVAHDDSEELDLLCQKFTLLGLASPHRSVEEEEEEDADFTTPPSTPSFFIAGLYPSKVDRDAYLALETVQIDPLRFPLVHRWFQCVQFCDREERGRWPNFDSPRAKKVILQ